MKLIGKTCEIKTGMYQGEWGIIKMYDGDCYHVALWGGNDCLVYGRDEIKVKRG